MRSDFPADWSTEHRVQTVQTENQSTVDPRSETVIVTGWCHQDPPGTKRFFTETQKTEV